MERKKDLYMERILLMKTITALDIPASVLQKPVQQMRGMHSEEEREVFARGLRMTLIAQAAKESMEEQSKRVESAAGQE